MFFSPSRNPKKVLIIFRPLFFCAFFIYSILFYSIAIVSSHSSYPNHPWTLGVGAVVMQLLISNDINGPNSGVFMMRRSDWSRKFLRLAIEAAPLLSVKSPWLPLRYENRAFFYLLDAWPSCACMRRLDSMLAPVHREARQLRRSVTTVDRCLLNRRPARGTAFEEFFNDVGSSFDDISDAFIAHAAGGNVTDKANALRHMLSFAFLNSTAAS